MPSSLFTILLASCALAAIGLVLFRPMTAVVAATRLALTMGGLRRTTIQGPRGRLVYWRGGSGDPLVLVHGVNDQAGTWLHVVRALRRRFLVLVPDLPGHEGSEPSSGPLSLSDEVAGLAALIDAEAPGARVTLVGNSMGGWVSLHYALARPDRVARIILVNSAALRINREPAWLTPQTREEAALMLSRLTSPSTPRIPAILLNDLVRRTRTSPIQRLTASDWERQWLDGRLQTLQAPVDVIWGACDQLLPLEYGKRIAREMQATFQTIDDAGHMPHREQPRAFVRALDAALSGLASHA